MPYEVFDHGYVTYYNISDYTQSKTSDYRLFHSERTSVVIALYISSNLVNIWEYMQHFRRIKRID